MSDSLSIPIICGPTGSGKTSLAVELAAEFPIEVVSADSRQIIRHLDIGTAKPTAAECAVVPMHLIDIIEPGERYTAFRFIDDANRTIRAILNRDRIPVVVGGTGLYLRALSQGIVEIDAEDFSIRDRLEKEHSECGAEAMWEKLKEIDPLEAQRTHPNNRARVIRALEIFELTGRSRSELAATGRYRKADYAFEYFCLIPPRAVLYERINARVDRMMADGLLEEVRSLSAAGKTDAVRAASVIGYNDILDHIEGRRELDEAVALIKQAHRRYAKRQFTWFRHQVDCHAAGGKEELLVELRARLACWNG